MGHDHGAARREPPALGSLAVCGTHASQERNPLSDRVAHGWNTARYLERTPARARLRQERPADRAYILASATLSLS